ncbi:alpha/beta hydrolase [Psychroserpens ponticola]|uniref:Alpha/beta hydrolase n=1 Tax=Psychroserpens ponticola TaxID=2932268 RepID=A0ABY7RW37_9FLAO|nr:alpha/beta hydrolase [Psychroserpens ponticola]WCO01048.1 alpha/beta hydrolase [Psychroserpens ponticola]
MIGASLYFLQEKILFLPTILAQDYQYEFRYPFEELFFETAEDVSINALHFKAENPKGVILYFHGNAGDLSRWGIIGEHFVSLDYDVLIMDYRTYGKSTGKLSEQGFYDDAEYCYNYLLKSYSEDDIVLYGRSLGTGVATYLASKHQPKQLILETPYYSILDVAKHRFPIFPVTALLKYEFPSNAFITSVDCPITIFHGTSDTVVPYSSAQKLNSVAPKTNTSFITIDGGGHNNLISFDKYKEGILSIL